MKLELLAEESLSRPVAVGCGHRKIKTLNNFPISSPKIQSIDSHAFKTCSGCVLGA
jgi:hypothetical protein